MVDKRLKKLLHTSLVWLPTRTHQYRPHFTFYRFYHKQKVAPKWTDVESKPTESYRPPFISESPYRYGDAAGSQSSLYLVHQSPLMIDGPLVMDMGNETLRRWHCAIPHPLEYLNFLRPTLSNIIILISTSTSWEVWENKTMLKELKHF